MRACNVNNQKWQGEGIHTSQLVLKLASQEMPGSSGEEEAYIQTMAKAYMIESIGYQMFN